MPDTAQCLIPQKLRVETHPLTPLRVETHPLTPLQGGNTRWRIYLIHINRRPLQHAPDTLYMQVEEGNIEYKLKLVSPTSARLEHLVTQMKWRLREGKCFTTSNSPFLDLKVLSYSELCHNIKCPFRQFAPNPQTVRSCTTFLCQSFNYLLDEIYSKVQDHKITYSVNNKLN